MEDYSYLCNNGHSRERHDVENNIHHLEKAINNLGKSNMQTIRVSSHDIGMGQAMQSGDYIDLSESPFEINWGLNKEYTDKLNLILNEKINNMDKVIKDWKDNLSNEEWNDLLKKYDHYGHDIGINESELIDMYNNEMNQKKHYYLIDGKIMKSSSKIPPTRIAVTEGHAKTEALKYHYQELYSRWRQSLKPCEISEYELEKIKNNIIDYWFHESNPIEVTDIVEEKESISNLESFIYFKQPEKVESDEIKNLKLDILQILQEEATTQYNPEGKDSRVICSDEFETVANQIINLFKMQKQYVEFEEIK